MVKPAPTEYKELYGDTLLVDVTHYAELTEQMFTSIDFEAQFVRLPKRDYRYAPYDSVSKHLKPLRFIYWKLFKSLCSKEY